jgi:hypothetical protein
MVGTIKYGFKKRTTGSDPAKLVSFCFFYCIQLVVMGIEDF